MGQQNIYEKNRKNLLFAVEKYLSDTAYQQYMKDHFLVGKNINKDMLKHNLLIQYALCTTNCDIIEKIWEQIKGI